jgi:four helix bundle protein
LLLKSGFWFLVSGFWLRGIKKRVDLKSTNLSGFHDLEIYMVAFDLALKVHHESLKLPHFELYEQGSQVRRSSKSIKDLIAEGYGRRKYKAEFIKYMVYSLASCDECSGQIETIAQIYPEQAAWKELQQEYDLLGKKINKFIQYVETNWNKIH